MEAGVMPCLFVGSTGEEEEELVDWRTRDHALPLGDWDGEEMEGGVR